MVRLESDVCWFCGKMGHIYRCLKPGNAFVSAQKFCKKCVLEGLDSPLVECSHVGCEVVTRRVAPGQQKHTCRTHYILVA